MTTNNQTHKLEQKLEYLLVGRLEEAQKAEDIEKFQQLASDSLKAYEAYSDNMNESGILDNNGKIDFDHFYMGAHMLFNGTIENFNSGKSWCPKKKCIEDIKEGIDMLTRVKMPYIIQYLKKISTNNNKNYAEVLNEFIGYFNYPSSSSSQQSPV